MAKAKEDRREEESLVHNDEDQATLAAIDEGLRDGKAGRTVPLEEVRETFSYYLRS